MNLPGWSTSLFTGSQMTLLVPRLVSGGLGWPEEKPGFPKFILTMGTAWSSRFIPSAKAAAELSATNEH